VWASLEIVGEVEEESTVRGKRGELAVIGKLLEWQFKIYTPLIDEGIDCLVDAGQGRYKEIQIKYSESSAVFRARTFTPRPTFFLICYLNTMRDQELWVIPSKLFKEMGTGIKIQRRDYVVLRVGKPGSPNYEKLRFYRTNINQLLQGATPEIRKAVEQAKRVEGSHIKTDEYRSLILSILADQEEIGSPLRAKEIVERFRMVAKTRFSVTMTSKWRMYYLQYAPKTFCLTYQNVLEMMYGNAVARNNHSMQKYFLRLLAESKKKSPPAHPPPLPSDFAYLLLEKD
jgi:hypothetical protein